VQRYLQQMFEPAQNDGSHFGGRDATQNKPTPSSSQPAIAPSTKCNARSIVRRPQ
jgi:hypothetical protein